jgi:hypothetical protein
VAAVGNPNNNNVFTIAMNGVPINQGDDGLCFGYEGDSGDPWEIKEAPLRDGWQYVYSDTWKPYQVPLTPLHLLACSGFGISG